MKKQFQKLLFQAQEISSEKNIPEEFITALILFQFLVKTGNSQHSLKKFRQALTIFTDWIKANIKTSGFFASIGRSIGYQSSCEQQINNFYKVLCEAYEQNVQQKQVWHDILSLYGNGKQRSFIQITNLNEIK